jgi:CYTH domain-containing protein
MRDRTKYARIERERRFLLVGRPAGLDALSCRDIEDRYITASRLRLRRVGGRDGVEYKLTQKQPIDGMCSGITTIYLDRSEYDLLLALPGCALRKRRHHYAHGGTVFAIDVFEGQLDGLVLAEAEATTAAQLGFIPTLPFRSIEVTGRPEFRGDCLAGSNGPEALVLARRLWANG